MQRTGRLGFLGLVSALFLLSWLAAPRAARAEPWLSTRFAQNCAGCHAPGRLNVQPIERRCTLSCQGCHVNPNGGGLRSAYGKWNEERWLRSFRADVLKNPKSTAPLSGQFYANGDKIFTDGKLAKPKVDAKTDAKSKLIAKGPGKDGFPLVEIAAPGLDEKPYLRDGREFQTSKSKEEFNYQIPQDDPLRSLAATKTSAGADIRWQATDYSYDYGDKALTDETRWRSFLMTADFGLEARPLNKYLHLVYEARMLGSPAPGHKYETQLGTASTHSLYAMVNDLPYDTFVMGGYYRPLFGNFVPDHYSIAQEITTYAMTGAQTNYNILFNAVSIGTAPNVPYLNVHGIGKKVGEADDKTQGIAANAGMRFVTLGASVNYSYWRTNDDRGAKGPKTSVEMHSIGGAVRVWRTVVGLDGVSVSRDVDTTDFRQGGVYSLDTYTQLWRENYFTLLLGKSNVTLDVKPGSTTQAKAGIRSFVIPGVDVMMEYEVRSETRKDTATNVATTDKLSGLSWQAHLYF